jgi:two-component system, NtrC family, sensor histidine kinase PilS
VTGRTARGVHAAAVLPLAPSGTFPAVSDDGETGTSARQRQEDLRTVSLLMLFRLLVASLLLLGVFSLIISRDDPASIDQRFLRFAAGLLVASYAVTLIHAVLLPRIAQPVRFAYLQIAADLLIITLLVHATGGVQSGFTFLYMLQVVAVALLPERYGAAYVAAASAGLFIAVSLAGYTQLLPPVPGQLLYPWGFSRADLWTRMLLNGAAIFGVGGLGMLLAGQSQRAGERLARHQRYAGDLASLHENTIRCLSSGLVTVTPQGLITSINDAASEILGLREASAVGLPLSSRIPGLAAVLAEIGPIGSVRRHEIDAVLPDGARRRLGISATPLSDHGGRVIGRVIHFQDLTELRRMQIQVERAERLASIGRFAAGIAHEIRNPLASISGSVEVLRGGASPDPETRQLVDIVLREVDRLNALITDLLEYARPPAEERQSIDLSEAASEIATAFELEKRPNRVKLVVEAPDRVCIEAGAGQVRQILWNLLRNASDAMPTGGVIRLEVARAAKAGAAPEAVLSITDEGVGIRKEDVERIFEPFFSTKARGTGLGLSIVARIVEAHRGAIEIESEPGRGTTFTLRFPALS